jgi:thiol-disulfide isomerase/thioredoxin
MRLVRILALALLGLPLLAHAQFDKQPWRGTMPPIDWVDMSGKRWTAQSLKGHTVVLNFWATWCPPCKAELPSLQMLHSISDGQPIVLGINVQEQPSRVQRYMQSAGLSFPVVTDPRGQLAKQWGVEAFPTTVLIAPNGQARWRVLGEVDWAGPEAAKWISDLNSPRR